MVGSEDKGWLRGAFLLAVAGLISKVLSAGYRIPLQNLTGDIGFYIYQQVYPLLGMALVLALYGFPSAISKLTAEAKEENRPMTWKHFYLPILLILLLVMGIVSVLLFLFAENLAVRVGDPDLSRAYQLVAFSLLIIPFTSLLRGVFQGNLNMKPTAYSQMGEQLVRVGIIIFVAMYVSGQGTSLYRIGEGAAIASLIGGVSALVLLLLFLRKTEPVKALVQPIPWRHYFQTILLLGLVAALNHMVLLLFQFADALTLIPALQEYGLGKVEAMEAKGVLDRGQPLIQLGTVLGSSFALAMIPTISRKALKANPKVFHQNIRSSIAVSFYLAVGATAGLIAILPEANILLFQDTKGVAELRILMIAILLSSVGITCATLLQGLGFMRRTAVFILVAFMVKWTGNEFLVSIFGIKGSAIATVIALIVFAFLVLLALKQKLPELKLAGQINWKTLILATSAMVLYILVINQFIPDTLSRLGALIYVVWIATTGAGIYTLILLRGRAFIAGEINMLPFSRILLRIYKERKINE